MVIEAKKNNKIQKNDQCMIPILAKSEKKIEITDNCEKPETLSDIKVYKRRWFQLLLFVAYSTLNNFQCFQFTIISNIIMRYYDISLRAVYWNTTIIMVTYIFLIFPASYLMKRIGLRSSVLIGCAGTCLGAWIKFVSSSPDNYFPYIMLGQSLVAISQLVVLSIPSRLAAEWFAADQVATATSMAYLGIPIGISAGNLITTTVVKNHQEIEDIGNDLYVYFLGIAVASTVVIIGLLLFFQNNPSLPPSKNRALQIADGENDGESFWPPVKRIIKNKYFILHWISYGVSSSILAASGTLMNPFLLTHFENSEDDVGRMGVGSSLFGGLASAMTAYILDKTKKFRFMMVTVCIICVLAELGFAYSLIFLEVKWMAYIFGILLGASLVSYSTMGLDMTVEITYPESEAIASGILGLSSQIFSTLAVLIFGELMEAYGDKAVHIGFIVVLTLATVLNAIDKGELRRQKAIKTSLHNNDRSLQILKPLTSNEENS